MADGAVNLHGWAAALMCMRCTEGYVSVLEVLSMLDEPVILLWRA